MVNVKLTAILPVYFLTVVMLKLMLSSSSTALLEATRVYGNMSLSKEVRDFIMENRGMLWTQTGIELMSNVLKVYVYLYCFWC